LKDIDLPILSRRPQLHCIVWIACAHFGIVLMVYFAIFDTQTSLSIIRSYLTFRFAIFHSLLEPSYLQAEERKCSADEDQEEHRPPDPLKLLENLELRHLLHKSFRGFGRFC
jgi:hypothetical protein